MSNYTHNLSNHRLYKTWNNLIQRCTNPNNKRYKDYGSRNIEICNEWKNDFLSFYNWALNNGYENDLTIDRIDNDSGYSPTNCRWTSNTIQMRNTRKIHRHNTSGYRGVSWCKGNNKWVSQIMVNKKKIHIGYFINIIDSAKAYDQYVIDNNLEHTRNFS